MPEQSLNEKDGYVKILNYNHFCATCKTMDGFNQTRLTNVFYPGVDAQNLPNDVYSKDGFVNKNTVNEIMLSPMYNEINVVPGMQYVGLTKGLPEYKGGMECNPVSFTGLNTALPKVSDNLILHTPPIPYSVFPC
jgi:hypothetical protein